MLRNLTLFCGLLFSMAACANLSAWLQTIPETCGHANGAVHSNVGGGQPPYTYAWTGPGGFTSTADSLFGVEAGVYTLLVTDNVGATATANGTVEDYSSGLPSGFGPTWAGASEITGYWGGACIGQCNGAGAFLDHISGGTPPFSYAFDVPTQYLGFNSQGGPVFSGFCLGQQVNYTSMDALGCPGSGWFVVYGVDASWDPTLGNIQGSCTGGNGGTATFMVNGPVQSFNILRSNGVVVDTQNGTMGWPLEFTDLAPGDYELETQFNTTVCTSTQSFTIPDLGANCAGISGTSWYDVDGDCIHDVGEVGIPGSVLEVQPGGYYTITHGDGSYALNLPAGNYTLAQTDATLVPICPATLPLPLTINGAPVVQDLANGSTAELDLRAYVASGPARPGFNYMLYGKAYNPTPQVSGPITVSCTFDGALTFVSATPTPASVVGNTITWNFAALGSFGERQANVVLNVPVGTALGTLLASSYTVGNTLPEVTLANNTEVEYTNVTGSYDPNVKEVRTSSQQNEGQYLIGTDAYLDYTIQFQNTGTDTAFTVVITDTLDAALDMATFEQKTSSHTCTVDFLTGRVVRWTFDNILLVDSTTNEPGSHGLTSFRIRLHEPVLPGVVIANNADIFFDFNEPVRTPDATVVTETSTGVKDATSDRLRLYPNPAKEQVRIAVGGVVRNAMLTIHDATGRELMRTRMTGSTHTLELNGLAAGAYLVSVRSEQGLMTERLLVE